MWVTTPSPSAAVLQPPNSPAPFSVSSFGSLTPAACRLPPHASRLTPPFCGVSPPKQLGQARRAPCFTCTPPQRRCATASSATLAGAPFPTTLSASVPTRFAGPTAGSAFWSALLPPLSRPRRTPLTWVLLQVQRRPRTPCAAAAQVESRVVRAEPRNATHQNLPVRPRGAGKQAGNVLALALLRP